MKRLFYIFIGLLTLLGFSTYEPPKKGKNTKICKTSNKTERHEKKW